MSKVFEMHIDVQNGLLPNDTLFMHGNLASNTWWEPSIAVWKNQPRGSGRAILGEWRGCGKSPAPENASELHPSVLADDYIRAIRRADARKVDVVAHSTGALIALYAFMKAPELFGRAVFLDPVGPRGVQFDATALDGFRQMSENRDICAAVMNTTIHGNDLDSPLFQRIVDDAFGIAKLNWQGVPAGLKNIDISAELATIETPILILHGDQDVILPVETSREMAAALPNGSFKLLPDQGHSLNVENPELFVKLVNEFLAS